MTFRTNPAPGKSVGFIPDPLPRKTIHRGEEAMIYREKIWRVLLLGLLFAPIGVARAAEDGDGMATQAASNRCADRCRAAEYARADAELNRAYKLLRCKLAARPEKDLVAAQRAWIGYRDASCRFEASGVEGGTAYASILNMCLTRKTRQRTEEISALAACEEGDLACPPKTRDCAETP
jgi:uncharacterized protein YecT (DUF1311 family)